MRFALLLLQVAFAPLVLAAQPRLSFERVTPAEHDLGGAEQLAIVHAPADGASVDLFVDVFVRQLNRSRFLRAVDARGTTGAADAYLSIQTFSCQSFDRSGEGSFHDVDGRRVVRTNHWTDTVCSARIDVMSNQMRRKSSFYGRGEGTSRRVAAITADERTDALGIAVRFAARDAAERISPRLVRESIELDARAPAFEEGFAMVRIDRVAEARAIWQKSLQAHPRSAALRYNLGVASEALGDLKAAAQHYATAKQLAPGELLYASELKRFNIRASTTARR